MYSMKEACKKTGLTYETLKFYCNQGLVPNVKRDRRNRRVFDDRNIGWINSLVCLRRCGMGISEMRAYMEQCLEGASSIPTRKRLLAERRELLLAEIRELQSAVDFIDGKQEYFDDILSGKIPFQSNLLGEE